MALSRGHFGSSIGLSFFMELSLPIQHHIEPFALPLPLGPSWLFALVVLFGYSLVVFACGCICHIWCFSDTADSYLQRRLRRARKGEALSPVRLEHLKAD